jgi:predicted deacylase
VISPIVNLPAVYGGRLAVSPFDWISLNRVFPGDEHGRPTERLAQWISTELLTGADAYLDLHSGGIDETLRDFSGYRISGDDRIDRTARRMSHAVGIERRRGEPVGGGRQQPCGRGRAGIPAVLVGGAAWRTRRGGRRIPGRRTPQGTGGARPDRKRRGPARDPGMGMGGISRGRGCRVVVPGRPGWLRCGGKAAHRAHSRPVSGGERETRFSVSGRVLYAMHGLTVKAGTELAAIARSLALPVPRRL